ncbi:hypothetical protein BON30_21520 [Cystobacter ferrugineus]|uniref:Lipoprotein n=2 Tax=Cystobacter ferrugineus TaxID=83449 RepID=A0A1L9B9V3_9BACT|nr:hypothetical protein BON30_21520 [Cystobacter ferrugineus]
MRTRLLFLGCLATACGGNISNDDLQFLNALPTREDLSAKLPGAERVWEMGSSRQRVAPLALGELSQFYANTRRAADDFNRGLDGVFSYLEGVRKSSPTTRTPEFRIWGPMENPRHPGHEVRFKMERKPEGFTFWIEFRPVGSDEAAWWSALEGRVHPEGGSRRGEGTLSILMAQMRDHGIQEPWFMGLERLDVDYQTSMLPISVRMHFVPGPPGSGSETSYAYHELPGGPGQMRFLSEDMDLVPGEQREKVAVLSRWTQDQGGMAIVEATGGDVPPGSTATLVECWDASFRTTYTKRNGESEEGDASSCPDVSALGE